MVVCVLGMAGGSAMAKTPRVVNPGGADRGVVDDTPYYGGFGAGFLQCRCRRDLRQRGDPFGKMGLQFMGHRLAAPTDSNCTCAIPRGVCGGPGG